MGDWVLGENHLLIGMSLVFIRNIAVSCKTTLGERLSHGRLQVCWSVHKLRMRCCIYGFWATDPF